MFKNAGRKLGIIIRVWTVICFIVVGLAVLGCSVVLAEETDGLSVLFGLLFLVFVEFFIWLGSLFMIGLCDMMSDVRKLTDKFTE